MKKIVMTLMIILLTYTFCRAENTYGIFRDSSNEITGKSCIVNIKKLPTKEGCTLELVSKSVYDESVIIEAKTYNDKRFKTSLLADSELNAFGFTVFYAAISDCLSTQNWEALNTIFSVMIAQGVATQDQANAFKAKILNEEGVSL